MPAVLPAKDRMPARKGPAVIYEPMQVRIVHTDDGGSYPEPPLVPEWPLIDRLRWLAGVIRAREGITIRFSDQHKVSGPDYSWEWPLLIGLHIGDISTGVTCTSVTADEAWEALNHIERGAQARRNLGSGDQQ